MGVIHIGAGGRAQVNEEECVECNNCYRSLRPEGRNPTLVRAMRRLLRSIHLSYEPPLDVCPTGALTPPKLEWPRLVRNFFSDVLSEHGLTGVVGRGTEEIKTNDVTGRLAEGQVGFAIDMGRPNLGVRFRDIEKVAVALARAGAQFEPKNPVTGLMVDPATGRMREDVLDEKVLSAIIELQVPLANVLPIVRALDEVQHELDTVFSVGIFAQYGPDNAVPYQRPLEEAGYRLSPNGKTNLGLGRRSA